MAQKKPENRIDACARKLEADFCQWDTLYRNGGSDPGWSDGDNLNLVRNHIMYEKKELEVAVEEAKQQDASTQLSMFCGSTSTGAYPAIYYRETPPEMSSDFMVKATEIRNFGKSLLAELQSNSEYKKFCDYAQDKVTPKLRRKAYVHEDLFMKTISDAVEGDNLVILRRYAGEPAKEVVTNIVKRGYNHIAAALKVCAAGAAPLDDESYACE